MGAIKRLQVRIGRAGGRVVTIDAEPGEDLTCDIVTHLHSGEIVTNEYLLSVGSFSGHLKRPPGKDRASQHKLKQKGTTDGAKRVS